VRGPRRVGGTLRAASLSTLPNLVAAGYGTTLIPAVAAGSAQDAGIVLRPLATWARRTVRIAWCVNFRRRVVAAVGDVIAGRLGGIRRGHGGGGDSGVGAPMVREVVIRYMRGGDFLYAEPACATALVLDLVDSTFPERDPGNMEARVARLESEMKELRDDMKQLRVDTAYIRGKLEHLPSTWVMLTGIIGGQVALAGLLFAASRLLAPH